MARPVQAAPVGPSHRQGILSARPASPPKGGTGRRGAAPIGLGGERDGILFVPEAARADGSPLLVMLHGAGASASDVWPMVEEAAKRHGLVVLAP